MLKKIDKYNLTLYLLWLALFKITIIPKVIQQSFKVVFIIIVMLFIIKHIKNKKNFLNSTLLFAIWIIITSFIGYINNYIRLEGAIDSILYSTCLYFAYIVIKFGIDNEKFNFIICSLYNVLLIYFIGSIITILIIGTSNSNSLLSYFAGNKFSTSYYILLFNVIFAIKHNVPKNNKIKYFCLALLSMILCKSINCSTTFAASILLLGVFIKNRNIKNILMDKKSLMTILILSSIIMVFFNSILENKYISYIIVNVLNENLGLTGRLLIYSYLKVIVFNNPIFGYGYGNTIIASYVGYGNAQNAIFQILVQYGFVGLFFFIILFYNSIKNKNEKSIDIWPLYIFLYIMLVCSSVEVSFNYMFFTNIFLISAFNCKNKKNELIQRKGEKNEERI